MTPSFEPMGLPVQPLVQRFDSTTHPTRMRQHCGVWLLTPPRRQCTADDVRSTPRAAWPHIFVQVSVSVAVPEMSPMAVYDSSTAIVVPLIFAVLSGGALSVNVSPLP